MDLKKYNIYPEYRPGQEKAIMDLLEAYRKIRDGEVDSHVVELSAGTGSGKCFAKGTKLVMYDGSIKEVQDVEVGDQLMGPDSTPRNVLDLSFGVGELYRVTPIRGGEPFICNGNHVLNLKRTNTRSNLDGRTINISVKSYLLKSNKFKSLHKLWHIDGVSFKTINKELPIPPYLFGIWLGDGSIRGPDITNPDKEIEDYLNTYAKSTGLSIRVSHQAPEKTNCPTFNFNNHWQGNVFRDFTNNLIQNYKKKRIPPEYLTSNTQNRLELMAGIIDSDGCYQKKGYEIIVKDNDLAEDVSFLARSLGVSVSSTKKIASIKKVGFIGEYNRLNLSGSNLIHIPCKVERKKPEQRLQKKDANVSGFSIEPIGLGEFYGFETDGDHLFLLKDFTVTHNSMMLNITGKVLLDLYPGEIERVTYTTPLTALVHQLSNDPKMGMPVVMGKSNYPCRVFDGLDASLCPYRSRAMMAQKPLKCRMCEYAQAKYAFKNAKIGVCTLDYYLFNRVETDVLIVDESASLEDRLLDNFGIALPDHIDLKNLVESIHEWMIGLEEESLQYEEALESLNYTSSKRSLLQEIQKLTKELNRTQRLVAKCGRILRIARDPDEYFIDGQRNFKLIRGSYPFNNMSSKVKLTIMASGTPTTSLICNNFTRVDVPHPIPVENRRVYYTPVGKMGRKDQDATIPSMAKKIMEIHAKCPKSTIVHCHSYGIATKLKQVMRSPVVLLQESGMRKEALGAFMKKKESIFLSVNYAEGIDLKGDQFQRNIIAKVPYPNLGDEWVIKRNDADKAKFKQDIWYRMSTAVDIQQASGRTTRDPRDYSETYILDENFGYFYKSNKRLFESWFVDALVMA